MKVCYFDCPSGAAGDMILASLVDAGFPVKKLHEGMRRLSLGDLSLQVRKTQRNGCRARLPNMFWCPRFSSTTERCCCPTT